MSAYRAFRQSQNQSGATVKEFGSSLAKGLAATTATAVAEARAEMIDRGWFGRESGVSETHASLSEAVYGSAERQDGDLEAMSHRYAEADRQAEQDASFEAEAE